MARGNLLERIEESVLILDGAMGTQLMAAGVQPGYCNDVLNLESPDIVASVHAKYLDAGSDAVLTNTFGANKIRLKHHGHADKAVEICRAAAELARNVAGQDRYVIGDIGPCGDFIEPLGAVRADDLKAAFTEQAQGLAQGGVDGFIIETMQAAEEMQLAIEAVRSVSDLPVLTSFAYDPVAGGGFRTMMGIDPAGAFSRIEQTGIQAVGYNCGTLDMKQYIQLTRMYKDVIKDAPVYLLAEPNAGKPELDGTTAVYRLTPDEYADALVEIQKLGARILGGCCGTSPAHIAAMAKRLKK